MIHNISDRTVHAQSADGGIEIVRYDRQGHWYVEIRENYGRHGLPAERKRVSLGDAVYHAKRFADKGGIVHFGEYGGGAFDRALRS